MTIVFEAYTGATQSGSDGKGRLPSVLGRAFDTAPTDYGFGRFAFGGRAIQGITGFAQIPRTRAYASDDAGDRGIGRLPAFAGFGADIIATPSVALQRAGMPPFQSSATTHSTTIGNQDAFISSFESFAIDAGDGISLARIPRFYGRAYEVQPPLNFVFAVQSPGFVSIVATGSKGRYYVEKLALSGVDDPQQVMVRTSEFAMDSSDTSLLVGLEQIQESMSFRALAFVVWKQMHAEALQLAGNDVAITAMVVQIAEALALLDGSGSALIGTGAVIEALRIGVDSGYAWPIDILEQIGMTADPAWSLLALNQPLERIAFSDGSIGYALITAMVSESLALADGITSTATLLHLINEGMEFMLRVKLPDGEYLAWVCNTESRAFTSYRNFPFNSFAEIDGHYYGATDTGIYLLEGDDDAGAPVSARLRTGLMDMGTGLYKRAEAMYLGYRSTGDLVLKVVVVSPEGEKQESWYCLQPRPSKEMVASRVKIGKGLKSTYFGFEIANVGGADFELDSMNFLPIVLERRIG